MNPIPPLLLAFALVAPLCAMADGRSRTVPLRVESAARADGGPSFLAIDGLAGLPPDGGIVEVRVHARGVGAADSVLASFAVLTAKTSSWRIAVDAPPAVLAAVTADRGATVSITACERSGKKRCSPIGARSVTLLRNTNG